MPLDPPDAAADVVILADPDADAGSPEDPALAADGDGVPVVAWADDEGIVVRRAQAGWQEPVRLSEGFGYEHTPRFLASGAGTCVAWDGLNEARGQPVFGNGVWERCHRDGSWSSPRNLVAGEPHLSLTTAYSVARTPGGADVVAWLDELGSREGGVGDNAFCTPCLGGIRLIADNEGRMHTFYYREGPWEHKLSADGGRTFSLPSGSTLAGEDELGL